LDRAAAAATPAASTGARFRKVLRWQPLALAASVATIAILVTIQVSMLSRPDRGNEGRQPPQIVATTTPEASAYERGLKWHLANTEQRLASLDTAQPDERGRLIEAIIEQNRMYALAADRANEPDLARVLRAFTPLLETLATERRDADASDIDQLSFELRVVRARLQATAQPPAHPQSTTL
jgi:hypothetical protein